MSQQTLEVAETSSIDREGIPDTACPESYRCSKCAYNDSGSGYRWSRACFHPYSEENGYGPEVVGCSSFIVKTRPPEPQRRAFGRAGILVVR